MYLKVTSRLTSELMEVKEYHPAQYGAPGKKRKKKKHLTPEAVKRQNEKNRERYLQNMILLNFDKGYHIVLRYPKERAPGTYEAAEDNLKAFTRTMRRRLSSKGEKFKYIGITERGKKREVLHHHIIVQNLEDINMIEEVRRSWEPYGSIAMSSLYEEGNYRDLAAYFLKKETKEEQKRSRYHISRGLKKPEVLKKEIIYGEISDPEAPRGWYIDPSSIIQGINPYTGKKYQKYYLRTTPQALPKKEEKKEKTVIPMSQINLYIEAQVKSGKGCCIYVLETMRRGEPVTVTDSACYEGDKEKLSLMAMIAALLRVKKPSEIKIYTSSAVIRGAIKNKWIDKWEDNGWKTNKGDTLKHAGLWKYVSRILREQKLTLAAGDDKNSYQSWMKDQLQKKEG
ncbi:MAG: hypothetical protein IKE94_07990 [Aeriscardovia sp.]|nr:hypothetical protein [Aeriscardovia sp.]